MFIFNSKDFYYLIPLAMVLDGLTYSGMMVANNSLLYSLAPPGEQKVGFFASWSASASLATAIAPLLGGFLVAQLKDVGFKLGAFPIGNLQILFAISALLHVLPMIFLRFVQEGKAKSAGYLLEQLRQGRPFAFAYNLFIFTRAQEEMTKAKAARAMGRSRVSMAVDTLVAALDDISPKVRRAAAKGLGDTTRIEAVDPLIDELDDLDSDVRTEAAESLGKLKYHEAIDVLIQALGDKDDRVRNSAAMSLAEIGGEEAQQALLRKSKGKFNRITFPFLVEALSRLGEERIIVPIFKNLNQYESLAIRIQLLSAVCRILGTRNRFYQLFCMEEMDYVVKINQLLQKAYSKMSAVSRNWGESRNMILQKLKEIEDGFGEEKNSDLIEAARVLLDLLWAELADGKANEEIPPQFMNIVLTMEQFFRAKEKEEPGECEALFLITCLTELVEVIIKWEKNPK